MRSKEKINPLIMEKRILKAYVQKVENQEQGILSVAVATDNSLDRDTERIESAGLEFGNFLKNPVLLWAHDYREEPIGKVLEILKDGDRTLFKPQFAIGHSEKAARIFNLFKDGFLNAFSIGFIPKEWKDENINGKIIRTFTKAELLEISAVPVPANPNALVLARSYASEKGMKEAEFDVEDLENIKARKNTVQSVVVSKEKFSTSELAKAKVAELEFKTDKVDETAESFRFRQFDPELCKDESFKTIDLDEGVAAITCQLKDGKGAEPGESTTPEPNASPDAIPEAIKQYIDQKTAETGAELKKLETSMIGIKTDLEAVGKAIAKLVEGESGVDIVKRVLQEVDKGLGEGLRLIKQTRNRTQ